MRTKSELQTYRDECCQARGSGSLVAILDRLIAGDESVRAEVEKACDQIDEDLQRYGEE